MIDQHQSEILRRIVVQACQKVGYSSAQTAPIAILQDILHWYLTEFTRDIKRHVEHYNRTEANSEDVAFSIQNMKLNIKELEDYIVNVDPAAFPYDLPNFPIATSSNLNFLKPGSSEVLTRPVHVHDYLPPMSPPSALDTTIESKMEAPNFQIKEETPTDGTGSASLPSALANNLEANAAVLDLIKSRSTVSAKMPADDFEAPSRQISSVFMTTGGFLSPAIEGKLPEAVVPDIIEKYLDLDAPPPIPPRPPTPPPPSPVSLPSIDKNEPLPEDQSLLKPLPMDKKKFLNPEAAADKVETESNKKPSLSKENVNVSKKDDSGPLSSMLQKKQAPNSAAGEHMHAPMPAKLLKKMKKKIGDGSALDSLPAAVKRKSHKFLKGLNAGEDFMSNIPAGADSTKIMKLLKKQVKQRQKKFKEQGLLKGKHRLGENQAATALQQTNLREIPNLIAPLMARQNALFGKGGLVPNPSGMNFPEGTSRKTPMELNPMPPIGVQTNMLCAKTDAPIEEAKVSPSLLAASSGVGMEIKLSNEPDRSKLNIFKKISKQKAASLSPTLPTTANNAFVNAENEVISLPSGLTITPSPAINAASFSDGNMNPKLAQLQGNATIDLQGDGQTINSLQTQSLLTAAASTAAVADNLVNKPKKRGRKPGSKNQPKVPPLGTNFPNPNMPMGDLKMLPDSTFRKPKKVKANKNMFPNSQDIFMRQQLQASLDGSKINATKSLNLVMPTQSTGGQEDTLQQAALFSSHLLPGDSIIGQMWPINLKSPHKERKDKDKNLMGELNVANQPTNLALGASSKLETADAGSFPSSAALPFNVDGSNLLNIMKDMTQRKSKKRPLTYFLGDGTQNPFSNLPPGILPVYPQFPFPPRPGLIPTAGLFPPPSGLPCFPPATSNIPGSQTAASAGFMGLPPSFMPFSNMNAAMLMKSSSEQDGLPSVLAPSDRSYCNVAPLVPESMTLKSSKFDAKAAAFNQMTTATKFGMAEDKALDQNAVLSSKKVSSSQVEMPNRPAEKATGPAACGSAPTFSKKKAPPTGGENDPIEVSDDSNDAPQTQLMLDNMNPAMSLPESTKDMKKQPMALPAPFSLIAAAPLLKSEPELSAKEMKKQKKIQRLEKAASSNHTAPLNLANLNTGDLNQFAAMSSVAAAAATGVSKLAGGADLIPLGNTGGLAYSAKSIPANSLTASLPPSKLNLMARNAPTNIFEEGITITPTMSHNNEVVMQKRKSKEHKKLKLKEGKIKKKKDKKAKLKNKEFSAEKGDIERLTEKELLRKLKKSKKKQKQRLQAEGQISLKQAELAQGMAFDHAQNLSLQTAVANMSSIVPMPALPEALETAGTTATVVPKLTLKLSTNVSPTPSLLNESNEPASSSAKHIPFASSSVKGISDTREASPELARFSPLITRPPKPKFNAGDAGGLGSLGADAGNIDHRAASSKAAIDSVSASATHVLPPSPWQSGGTLSASSVLLPQQLMQSSIKNIDAVPAKHSAPSVVVPTPSQEKERPSSYIDDEGNRVWICPACGKIDDGSPMIGCDGCDAWYHWICVGIVVAPKENEDWYCRVCITQKKGGVHAVGGEGKKRKRSKKNK